MFYPLLKSLLFRLEPEHAHELTLATAKLGPFLGKLSGLTQDPKMVTKVGNLQWAFPVGLAAGLDKNAEAVPFFAAQGFGALELGTITLKPQDGNPRPRVWRYPEEESLRNAMGFPNHGLLKIFHQLQHHEASIPLGANLGKNKESSPEESIDEISLMLETLKDSVSYFAVNVSSPNTPGLRAMQEPAYLTELFQTLNALRGDKNLYLKIAPDLEPAKVRELTHLVADQKLTGIIATNTTIMPEKGIGGVSGKLLTQKAKLIRQTVLEERAPIEVIGVGGISSSEDVFDFWRAGGKAVQVYSAYVFQGPCLLKNIHRDINAMLERTQIKTLEAFFALNLEERKKILN